MSFAYPEEETTGNYVADHWRGLHPLPRSYWINSVLITNVSTVALLVALSAAERSSLSLQVLSALSILTVAVILAIGTWALVGVWRSANRHEARGGSGIWAGIAKAIVCLGSLAIAGQIVNALPGNLETAKLALGQDTLGTPADISLTGTGDLRIAGPIAQGTAAKFAAALSGAPQVRVVELSSTGGRMREARQIAQMVRKRQLDTLAQGECASACTLVLLAGANRTMMGDTRIGFHQPTFPGIDLEQQMQMVSETKDDYLKAGLSAAFVARALEAAPDRMWYPSEEELLAERVLTGFSKKRIIEDNLRSADALSERAPLKIDEITSLIQVKATGLRLRYTYSVMAEKSDFAPGRFRSIMRAANAKEVCSNPVAPSYLRSGAAFDYEYRDRDGQTISTFTVDRC